MRLAIQGIRCLLIEPYPESALNEEAAMLMHDAYEDYEKQARYRGRCTLSSGDSVIAAG